MFVACLFCCVGFWYDGNVGLSAFQVRQVFRSGTQEKKRACGPLCLMRENRGNKGPQMLHFRPLWKEQLWGKGEEGENMIQKNANFFGIFAKFHKTVSYVSSRGPPGQLCFKK